MKRNRLEYIIPTLLALIITIGLIRFIPVLSLKYMMKELKSESRPVDDYNYYFDLNGDGNSELFTIYYNASGNLAISIAGLNQATINQFNLPGKLTRLGNILDLHDINRDGIADIFICTEKNDSLFLTIIDDLYSHPTTTREYFLDQINQYNDNGDYLFVSGALSDLTRDGYPEYVFAINGGHALQPRRVYTVDYRNNLVLRSPVSGAAVISLDLFDLDRDGVDEILLNTVAPENFKETIPFRDSISWLMVLDESLQFYKPPVALNHAPSWLSLEPFIHRGDPYLIMYHRFGEGHNYDGLLSIYNDSLQLVQSRYFMGHTQSGYYLWRGVENLELHDIKLLNNRGAYTIDMDLQFNDSILTKNPFGYDNEVQLDVDNDGEKEYVFAGYNGIQVFRSDLKQSTSMEYLWSERAPRTLISIIEDGENYPVLFVQCGTQQIYLDYSINNWFKYRGLVYPGIFILLFGVFYSWVILQNRIVSGRFEKDRLISQLQLQSIKNQLDPHFTYNALNAVGSLIYKGEKELAYQYLKGLTDLLRMVSNDSAQVTWSLSNELDFVIKYLEIEKLRFREKFNYTLDISEDRLKEFQVPKMAILTFVENAIKHGLRHKEYDRRLQIRVSPLATGLKIEIEDNGIGRTAAARYQEESAGNGIEMMQQYFRQFNDATGQRARFEVKDLFEYDLKAAGTLVEVIIK